MTWAGPTWRLDRYVRPSNTDTEGAGHGNNSKTYDDSEVPISLSITHTHQLFIRQKDVVLESHNIVALKDVMRGVANNYSILFYVRHKPYSRKFRVRFSGEDQIFAQKACDDCIEYLKHYIPIKVQNRIKIDQIQNENFNDAALSSKAQTDIFSSTGELTLGAMARSLLAKETLPQAYQHCHVDDNLVQGILQLCLADPTFPAFVEKVDKALQEVAKSE